METLLTGVNRFGHGLTKIRLIHIRRHVLISCQHKYLLCTAPCNSFHPSPGTICSSSARTRQPRKREDTVCSGESRWELPAKKRRGGSGERGSVALAPHVSSGTDPAIYAARKISGRPCVPGRLGKNRAPADRLRRGLRWNSGMMECWNVGEGGRSPQPIVPIFHCSIIPILLSSSAGGRLCQDFRPRRASLRSCARTEPTGPKPTRPEEARARPALPLNRLFSWSWGYTMSSGRGPAPCY